MSAENFRRAVVDPSDRVIVALDNMDWDQVGNVMEEVGPHVGLAKANSIAQASGWNHAVEMIDHLGALTMADTKFHDIPATVGLQVEAVTKCRASLITVHASGGNSMLEAAVNGAQNGRNAVANTYAHRNIDRLGGILGITVLTSLDTEECYSIYGDDPETKVVEFAKMAQEAGVDGIVCSGKELEAIRAIPELDGLLTVVPGITPSFAKKAGDQKRIVTPSEALQRGADFMVIGRAITKPPEEMTRAEAAQRIAAELKEAA